MKDFKTLIIPDVHGRDFWKEPVKETLENTDAHIVFLGDYVDPYPREWGSFDIDYQQKAFDTLLEIIELKKEHSDRITLLLGNHDYGYIDDSVCECRRDRKRYRDIQTIFKEYRELFNLAYEDRVADKHFIYSHAGISKKYAEICFGDEINEDNVVDMFNNAYLTDNYGVLGSLGIYDCYRGNGGGDYASLIWTDIREWYDNKPQEGYGYLIFGHSQIIGEEPIIGEKVADLDCRKAFVLDNEGGIKDYLLFNS